MKKFLAALAASAMALSMMGVSAFAEGLEDDPEILDDVTETEVVEETEILTEEVTTVTEAAPVETAPSPATGNSPVAMAVIPVALAAAAIVAKKAK